MARPRRHPGRGEVKARSYARLSVPEKQADDRNRMREPSVSCPHCEVQTTVADLLQHVEQRCARSREPHLLSRWISWREAISLGVKKSTMGWWIEKGLVRWQGQSKSRVYLMRDIVTRIASRQRRKSSFLDQKRRGR